MVAALLSIQHRGRPLVNARKWQVTDLPHLPPTDACGAGLRPALIRISHKPSDDVAHAPTRAVSRLFSTLRRAATRRRNPSVARSGDAARKSACATALPKKSGEKFGLAAPPDRSRAHRKPHAYPAGMTLNDILVGAQKRRTRSAPFAARVRVRPRRPCIPGSGAPEPEGAAGVSGSGGRAVRVERGAAVVCPP